MFTALTLKVYPCPFKRPPIVQELVVYDNCAFQIPLFGEKLTRYSFKSFSVLASQASDTQPSPTSVTVRPVGTAGAVASAADASAGG